MAQHEALMALALEEADKGRGRASPNPMVGCVIAKRGRVIATGYHRRAGLPHAEPEALRAAGSAARGADVYVNLEPCMHHGRTAPCTDALIAAQVKRVFVGTRDPNPVVDGRGIRRLRAAGIEVHLGLLGAESRRLNEAFEHRMRTGRVFVVAKIAQSLDGRVATRSGESKSITGDPARRLGHRLRDELDAILVGIGTVLADDPRLTCRVRGGRDPVRVIVDSKARTPLDAAVVRALARSKAPTLIAVGPRAPKARCDALTEAGAEVVVCADRDGRVDLEDLLRRLAARDLLSVLVEGGPQILGSLFDARLVDKVHAFVAPMIIGGNGATSSIGAHGAEHLRDVLRLGDLTSARVGDDFLVIGYPR